MAVTAAKEEVDYTIKPEAGANNINTADWPLLLKNYEKRMSNRSFLFLPFSDLQLRFIISVFKTVADHRVLSNSFGANWPFHANSCWLLAS